MKKRLNSTMKKIYSSPSLFGGMNYYDESGHQIGYSTESLFGGRNFYDESGHHVGYSTESLFGGENYYSDQNGYMGYSTLPQRKADEPVFHPRGLWTG